MQGHATNIDELEKCATAIENDSIHCDNDEEWADHIRILAYGLDWYLKEQLNSGCHQEYKKYLQDNGLENPFEELEIALNNIK